MRPPWHLSSPLLTSQSTSICSDRVVRFPVFILLMPSSAATAENAQQAPALVILFLFRKIIHLSVMRIVLNLAVEVTISTCLLDIYLWISWFGFFLYETRQRKKIIKRKWVKGVKDGSKSVFKSYNPLNLFRHLDYYCNIIDFLSIKNTLGFKKK